MVEGRQATSGAHGRAWARGWDMWTRRSCWAWKRAGTGSKEQTVLGHIGGSPLGLKGY